MCCLDGLTRIHSVGVLDGAQHQNRYVAAIMTEGHEGLYGSAGRAAVSAIAEPLAALGDILP